MSPRAVSTSPFLRVLGPFPARRTVLRDDEAHAIRERGIEFRFRTPACFEVFRHLAEHREIARLDNLNNCAETVVSQ